MNDTWGYKSYDTNWKSSESLIRNLVDIASKGGNYLLNVGPTSEGLIPAPSIERLKEVGAWMRVNGNAIYDTTASPFKNLPWGRCTKRTNPSGATLYLHVFDWPADGRLMVPGLKSPVQRAWLLANGMALKVDNTGDGVVVHVPAAAPNKISSTVAVKIAGGLVVDSPVLTQQPDGTIALRATEAETHGEQLKYESGDGHDNLGYWINPTDWAEWQFRVTAPGKFTVTAEIAAQGRGSFELAVGNRKLKATAPNTGSYVAFQQVELGTIEIPSAGKVELTVHPVAEGWQPLNLRLLKLTPAR